MIKRLLPVRSIHRQLCLALLLALAALLSGAPLILAHESPIDHIDRVVQIYIDARGIHLSYKFRCEERQVMLQLLRMDKNNDGIISDQERTVWFDAVASDLARELHLEIDGKPVTLTIDGPVHLAPDLSQTYTFSAPLPALSPGAHTGRFTDEFSRTHPGQYRWRPRQVTADGYDVDANEAPGLEQMGSHPAMIVINLKIRIAPVTTQPTTQPAK